MVLWDTIASSSTHHLAMASSFLHPLPSSCLTFPSRSLSSLPSSSASRLLPSLLIATAQHETAVGPSENSIASEVAVPAQEPQPPKRKKPSPLEKGGTLLGAQAEGKDPGLAALGKPSILVASADNFSDSRWENGNWDLRQFTKNGKVDWDAVIDAEVLRRKWLEEKPEASRNDDPVVFETSSIPWWAWVKRFHLPEAELLNGRAAMVGFFMGYLVDILTGVGLVDQTSSFFGKLLLFITVVGILFIRKNEDLDNVRQILKEWNFYDKQWQASWQDQPPSNPDQQ